MRRGCELEWEIEVPIYHPTSTLTAVVYCDGGRGRAGLLGKLQYRISNLMVISGREQVKSLRLRSDARDERSVRCSAGTLLVSFRCLIPDRRRLLQAYERSPYPPTVHLISLFHGQTGRDAIVKRHHEKVVSWLASADPPVPEAVAWKVLETGRERFRLARARYNIQRFKEALSFVGSFLTWFRDLRAWRRPWLNLASVFVAWWVCFYPAESLLLFLLYRSAFALRRLLRQGLVEYLGVELGELFDTTGLLPSDLLADELLLDDDDDDAASGTAMGGGGDDARGGRPGGGGGGGGYGGGAGGGLDSAAAMVFRPRRLRALKRRYEQLLRVSLQVQNRIDDLASGFERLRAMVGGQDPLATALFFARCLAAAAAAWALGPGRAAFAWWCWEALRPPGWRAPPGLKGPIPFLMNLPSRSADE
ncbi:MAG: hypothetical protein J3K34DRAFT_66688 [Monoraphidium minutum]|nr:MAG: hypothetical protein J3K34DRAFT_66688 [Monoraphidium minutum]